MTAPLPFASIIVPVYNGQRMIQACLEALLHQTYPAERYEVIVVDNNSTARTVELVRSFPVCLLFECDVQTSYAARNRGIRAAKGEILVFTDADCIAAGDWLEEMTAPFRQDPDLPAVCGDVRDAPPESMIERFITSLHPFVIASHEHPFLPLLLTCSAAIRKEALQQAGVFSPNLYTIGDIDLGWRIQLQTGRKLVYAPGAVVLHRHRGTWRGMYKQQHRAGFGRMLLNALYRDQPGYPVSLGAELRQIGRQILAILTYLRAIVYRWLTYRLRGKERYYAMTPIYYLVAETGFLLGKLKGLWVTRFFRRSPARLLLEDPLER